MKKLKLKTLFLVLLSNMFVQPTFASDEFGRLFTTPAQRKQLDELRKKEGSIQISLIEEVIELEEETEDVDETPVNALTVRGLVYRNDGKNTAWINDNNTFEGGVSLQYISVGDIKSDRVEIKVPSANTIVNLNVGQTFDPISEDYKDLIEESETKITEADSTNKRPASSRP
jgi:hypothetical protein